MTTPREVEPDRVATQLALELLDCLCEQLESSLAGRPARCCLVAGASVVADDCCDGQATVRVTRLYPTGGAFPALLSEPTRARCGDGWAVELELSVLRCACTPGDDGTPPSCECLQGDALTVLSDAAAMRRAVSCCFGPADRDRAVLVGTWQPVSGGGCTGGSMLVTVSSEDCCPED